MTQRFSRMAAGIGRAARRAGLAAGAALMLAAAAPLAGLGPGSGVPPLQLFALIFLLLAAAMLLGRALLRRAGQRAAPERVAAVERRLMRGLGAAAAVLVLGGAAAAVLAPPAGLALVAGLAAGLLWLLLRLRYWLSGPGRGGRIAGDLGALALGLARLALVAGLAAFAIHIGHFLATARPAERGWLVLILPLSLAYTVFPASLAAALLWLVSLPLRRPRAAARA